jgi:hypothetical protein
LLPAVDTETVWLDQNDLKFFKISLKFQILKFGQPAGLLIGNSCWQIKKAMMQRPKMCKMTADLCQHGIGMVTRGDRIS